MAGGPAIEIERVIKSTPPGERRRIHRLERAESGRRASVRIHSILMPAARMIFANFSMSVRIWAANSADVLPMGS
jgi:hypothetical protein